MTKTRDQRPALTQDQTLQRAVNHHKAGQLQEAERLYRVILQAQPQHPEANHNMGMIALQVKQPAAGLPYFKTALEANPNQRQYWLSYINALIQTGQTDDAKKVLAQGRQRGLRGEAVDALTGRLNGPSSDEINSLVALFNRGRYAEGEALAHRLTVHFPQVGFAWKALGLMLKIQGRSAEALVPMQKAAALLPIDAEAHSNLGNTLQEQGRLTEAEASHRRALEIRPDFTEAHYNLGNTLQEQGRLMEAEATYCRALELNPNFAEAHNNLGNTLQEQGQLTEAEACYHRALEIMPEYAVAYNNLGNTLRDQGRITDSEASYRMALAIKPEYAEAHSNLGNTLADQGRLVEAEASYRRALEIMPEYAEAHSNLGNTLREQGRLTEAEASYRQALASKPDYVEALNNLALLLNAQGEYMMALSNIKQSLQIKETGEAKKIFVNCVKRLCWTHDDSKISIAMVRALSEPWGRPSDLARISADIIKLNRDIGRCVARASDAWPLRLSTQDLYRSNGLTILAANPLLYALLDSTAICDIEMERLLTMARSAMLDTATGMTASGGEVATVLIFYSALARQCFINEYVFSYTDDEIQRASNLRDSLVAALETNTQVPVLWLIAVASYFPLCSLPLAARLLDFQWPEAVTVLLVQQLREPEEELQLRTTIPRLTNIEDEVSLLVQNQYEENPYPRWVRRNLPRKQ